MYTDSILELQIKLETKRKNKENAYIGKLLLRQHKNDTYIIERQNVV